MPRKLEFSVAVVLPIVKGALLPLEPFPPVRVSPVALASVLLLELPVPLDPKLLEPETEFVVVPNVPPVFPVNAFGDASKGTPTGAFVDITFGPEPVLKFPDSGETE